MKHFLLAAFILFSTGAFAQYGKLEPLDLNNDSFYVLRTPEATIKRLQDSTDKVIHLEGQYIEAVERQLEFARQGYLTKRIPTFDTRTFLSGVKYLEDKGVNVNYYVQEYFLYYPRRNSRQ